MTVESGKENFRLGFLTAIEVPERGFVGGLLVTNHFGRPLEFQCTARSSRIGLKKFCTGRR
jgi:hypothetical protein